MLTPPHPLLSGGIRFPDMTQEEGEKFQENLIKVMIAMERTFFTLASTCKQNCIVICDRGIMDATAYMSKESWEKVLKGNGWNAVELRDNRYNQVVHLVTSASGAEAYYNCEDNPCRTEGLEQARELDRRTAEAWVGHPYIDVMDNSTDFDTKMRRMISAVCRRIGLQAGDRLKSASRKIKFLVRTPLPPESAFPSYQDFDVVHDYLITANPKIQSRLRKRGQSGNWSYQHTVRRSAGSGGDRDGSSQLVELRRQISHRDYVVSVGGDFWKVELLFFLNSFSFLRQCWRNAATTITLSIKFDGASSGSRPTFSWTSTASPATAAASAW